MFSPDVKIILITAFIPLIIGALWYGYLFSKKWMEINNFTAEALQDANKWKILGLTLLFGLILSGGLLPAVIHQMHVFAALQNVGVNEVGTEANKMALDYMSKYGAEFRTFRHGVLHGIITALFIFLPTFSIVALHEQKKLMYVIIHVGYWVITLGIMGGIISAWA